MISAAYCLFLFSLTNFLYLENVYAFESDAVHAGGGVGFQKHLSKVLIISK